MRGVGRGCDISVSLTRNKKSSKLCADVDIRFSMERQDVCPEVMKLKRNEKKSLPDTIQGIS